MITVTRSDLRRVVVAVDPAASHGEESDDTGIIVVGRGPHQASTCKLEGLVRCPGHAYVLDDRTCHLGPHGWASAAVDAFDAWDADLIVGEVNNGGDMVESTVRNVRPGIPFKQVRASRGKRIRAEPASALYEQGRCVSEGSPVITRRGDVPIENVHVGDEVWTRKGWRRVAWSGMTAYRETVCVTTDDGHRLVCTPDHKVWTENRGFVQAERLARTDILRTWPTTGVQTAVLTSPSQDAVADHVQRNNAGATNLVMCAQLRPSTECATTEPNRRGTTDPVGGVADGSCIGTSGRPRTGRSRMAGTSITGTTTRPTTVLKTLSHSIRSSTFPASTANTDRGPTKNASIRATFTGSGGYVGNRKNTSATTAASDSTARRPVSGSAHRVAMRSFGMASPGNGVRRLVARVERGPVVPLYDLTVPDCPEFVASGVLVHNCHHCGVFSDLETQMTTWMPDDEDSPDRVDALVWGIVALELIGGQGAAFLSMWRGQTERRSHNRPAPRLQVLRGGLCDHRWRAGGCVFCGERRAG